MTEPVIPYRSPPDAADQRLAQVRSRLAERAGGSMALAVMQLVGGALMTVVVGWVVGSVVAVASGTGSVRIWTWLTWIILTPFLLWYERRTRGAATEGMLDGHSGTASSYGEWEMRRTTAMAMLWTEFFLIGPRLIWWGGDHWRERHAGAPRELSRAAEVVIDLLELDSGVHPSKLLREWETLADLAPVVRYLERQDWVGVSRRRDRVWLLTEARQRLGDELRT